MRNTIFIAALLPLAACDSGPEVDMKNASVQEVAEEVRQDGGLAARDGFMRAGLWSTSVELTELEAPNMPAMVRDQMRKSMARTEGHETCLTPEDAQKPKEDFFAGAGKDCRYDHYRMGDGRIDAKMRCQHQGMTQLMEMSGTYSPDHYRMTMTTRTDMPDTPMGAMTMKMNLESKRIGDCDKDQASRG